MSNSVYSITESLQNKIKNSFNEFYVVEIERQIDAEVNTMINIIKEVKSFDDQTENGGHSHSQIIEYKSILRARVDEVWCASKEVRFSEVYSTLAESLNSILDEVEVQKEQPQKKERFVAIQNDSISIKLLKSIKFTGFHLSKTPTYFTNLFRKKKKPVNYWSHSVHLRNLTEKHFKNELAKDLVTVTDLFFKKLCFQYLEIKKWDEKSIDGYHDADQTVSSSTLNEFKRNLNLEIREALDEILETRTRAFITDFERAGTIELPNSLLSDSVIAKHSNEAEMLWAKNNHQWKNTIYALFEEWRSDIDIYTLRHKTLLQFGEFQSAQLKNLGEHIDTEINEIKGFIEESINAISTNSDSIQKELKRINYQANKKLDKELVPKLCDKLSSQHITNLINALEQNIKQNVKALSNEYVVVKTNTYDEPVKTVDLGKISPYELISFEMLEVFQDKLSSIRKELFIALEDSTLGVKDLDHIVTFSLSSAIFAIEEEGKSIDEAISIAQEGLTRTSDRLVETRKMLEEAITKNNEHLEAAVNQFCESIMELIVNENVREIKLRIAKAKTAKQAEEIKQEIGQKLIRRKNLILIGLKNGYNKVRTLIYETGERFILTAKKPILTKEISNFLIESQQTINRLPLIYRRLYRIEPIEDLELFEGRKEEFGALKVALENWKNGYFATTAIIGEKWGGLTSFLNFSVKEISFPCSVVRFSHKENIYSEEALIELLRKVLNTDDFENIDQVVEYLNDGPKKVIIIEDLQNLYLRKVQGFGALVSFFQLITRTNTNVFWIVTTTVYTWTYLSKTININEYFSYVIEMKALNSEQIVNIIWKRNRISGFKIRFEASSEVLKERKFNKMDDSGQQLLLKEEFFNDLNEFAKSNVSMALIFWLLSTKKIDEQTITIGTFYNPSLNFMTMLSMDKIYTLHCLILHDGLSEYQLSKVLNNSENSCRLSLLSLLEDGIVSKKDDTYMVNPLVYRATIGLLKSKNLIH